MSTERSKIFRTYTLKDIPFLPPFDISRGVIHIWRSGSLKLAEVANDENGGLTLKLFSQDNQQKPDSETQIGSLAGKVILIAKKLDEHSQSDVADGGFVSLIKTPEGNDLNLTLCYPDTLTGNDPDGFIMYGAENMDRNSGITLEIVRAANLHG